MEGITTAKTYLNEISTIFRSTIGPNGKDILLKSDTGVTYVTRTGSMILQQLGVKHPVAKLIKNAVQTFSSTVGDFTKVYLILLDNLVDVLVRNFCSDVGTRRIESMHSKLSSISISLLTLRSKLHSDVVKDYIESHRFLTRVSSNEFLDKYFDGLFYAVLCEKFNAENTSIIKNILIDTFRHFKLSRNVLLKIINNFSNICIDVNGIPFTQSKFVEGVIIQREPKPDGVIHDSLCRFIVMTGNMINSSTNVELSLNGETDLARQHNLSVKFFERLVKILKDNNISLLFCEGEVPNVLSSLLESAKMTFVPFVLEEDLNYVCTIYNITPVSGLHDLLFIENFEMITGTSSYFKSCILGVHISSHLGPPPSTVPSTYTPFQIILCSLYEGMKSQYLNALLNVTKAIYNCYGPTNDYMYLIPSCGFFEMVITEMIKKMITNEKCIFDEKDRYNWDVGMVTCENNNSGLDQDVRKLFVQSMNNTTKCLFKITKSVIFDVNSYSRISNSWCYDDFTCIINEANVQLYEPFYSKMKMIESVLDVCAQISRIDHIIRVKQLNPMTIDDSEFV